MALALTRKQLAQWYDPPADYGFFGPDSVTWKVWSYPTSFILGFVRSVTIEHLDPNLAAAVIQSGGVKYRPYTRYTRTLRYFGMVMFGATEPTAKAADVLVKIHSKAIGNDPVTHGTYDANQPSSQLWIHMTAWHSILRCYELYGPGRLSAEEEAQFWVECARAAELQTIDPATVPRSRDEVRQYFADWRPHLATSEGAQDMARFILSLEVALPPETGRLMPAGDGPDFRRPAAGRHRHLPSARTGPPRCAARTPRRRACSLAAQARPRRHRSIRGGHLPARPVVGAGGLRDAGPGRPRGEAAERDDDDAARSAGEVRIRCAE